MEEPFGRADRLYPPGSYVYPSGSCRPDRETAHPSEVLVSPAQTVMG